MPELAPVMTAVGIGTLGSVQTDVMLPSSIVTSTRVWIEDTTLPVCYCLIKHSLITLQKHNEMYLRLLYRNNPIGILQLKV